MKTDHILRALAGTYTLLNTTYWKLDNLTAPSRYQTQQKGILVYSPWGYVSANLVSTDPEKRPLGVVPPPASNGTEHEWALVGQYTLAYSGPLSINTSTSVPATETEGHILHGPLVVANVPALEDTILGRNYLIFQQDHVSYLNLSFKSDTTRADILWKRIA